MGNKGQAIVEFAFAAGVLALILHSLLIFCQAGLLRQRALAAARYGAKLQASGLLEDSTVNSELEIMKNKLEANPNTTWEIETGRFLETPSSRFYHFYKTDVRGRYRHALWRWLGLEDRVIREKIVVQKQDGRS